MKYTTLILLSCLIFSSCKSNQSISGQKNSIDDKQNDNSSSPITLPKSIAPEFARIIGKIVAHSTSPEDTPEDSPCSKYPCYADVLIETVEGYGSSFSDAISAGQTVKVYFPYTLHHTKAAFPGKDVIDLPGLNPNDLFQADMEAKALRGTHFTIYQYLLKK